MKTLIKTEKFKEWCSNELKNILMFSIGDRLTLHFVDEDSAVAFHKELAELRIDHRIICSYPDNEVSLYKGPAAITLSFYFLSDEKLVKVYEALDNLDTSHIRNIETNIFYIDDKADYFV